MAELVDALDLGSSAARCGGSSPFARTIYRVQKMKRRSFIKSILATGIAPYVVTTAGILMPVRQIVPVKSFRGKLIRLRAYGRHMPGPVKTEFLEQYFRELPAGYANWTSYVHSIPLMLDGYDVIELN